MGQLIATGEYYAAGIGGGPSSDGSYITINGGKVEATGDSGGAGIGGGYNRTGSNIKVASMLTVYAGDNNPPTTEILHATDYDIAAILAGKQFAIVKNDITGAKEVAIEAISTAVAESDNDNVKAIATNAINTINASTNLHEIEAIKAQALAAIASAKAAYTEGKAEGIEEGDAAGYERGYEEGDAAGYQRAFDELPTDAQDAAGHTVTIIKGDKALKLVNPEKVEFGKQ